MKFYPFNINKIRNKGLFRCYTGISYFRFNKENINYLPIGFNLVNSRNVHFAIDFGPMYRWQFSDLSVYAGLKIGKRF